MTGSDYSHEWRRDLADTLDRIGIALGKLASALADHERRIERIDGMLDGMGKGIEVRVLDAERRIAAIERKLNHKGGNA